MLRDRQEQISQGASAPGTCDMPASQPLPRHCTFAAFPGPSIAFRWPFAACVWPLAAFHWPFHCPVAHFLCQDTVPLALVVPLPFLGRSLHLRCLLLDHSLAFCCLSAFPLRFRCLHYVLSTVLSPHFLDLPLPLHRRRRSPTKTRTTSQVPAAAPQREAGFLSAFLPSF